MGSKRIDFCRPSLDLALNGLYKQNNGMSDLAFCQRISKIVHTWPYKSSYKTIPKDHQSTEWEYPCFFKISGEM